MYLIRAGAVENIEWLIRKRAQNPHLILNELNLTSAILREPESLLSYSKIAQLLEHCSEQCDDPWFGFHLAQVQSPLALGEFASLINQQNTFGEALTFSQKYLYLHARGLSLDVQESGDRIEVHYIFEFSIQIGLEQLLQLSIGQYVEYVKLLLPEKYQQLRIHTKQVIDVTVDDLISKPQAKELRPGAYRHLYARSHQFDGVSFPKHWLATELSKSKQVAQAYSRQRIQALNGFYPNDLSAQVRYLCSNLLATGECNIDVVANALGLQSRTLQRKLCAIGVNFRDLLQGVRLRKAQQYLQNSRLSITDIALNLGYSEAPVFSRNFKNWTGKSPLKWRSEHSLLFTLQ